MRAEVLFANIVADHNIPFLAGWLWIVLPDFARLRLQTAKLPPSFHVVALKNTNHQAILGPIPASTGCPTQIVTNLWISLCIIPLTGHKPASM